MNYTNIIIGSYNICQLETLVAQVSNNGLKLGGLFNNLKVNVDEYKELIDAFKNFESINDYISIDNVVDWDNLSKAIGITDTRLRSYLETLDDGKGHIDNTSASVEGMSAYLKKSGQSFNFAAIKSKSKYEELTEILEKAELSAKLKQLGIDEEALLNGSEEEFEKLKNAYMDIVFKLNEGNDEVLNSLRELSGYDGTAPAMLEDSNTKLDTMNTDLGTANTKVGNVNSSLDKTATTTGNVATTNDGSWIGSDGHRYRELREGDKGWDLLQKFQPLVDKILKGEEVIVSNAVFDGQKQMEQMVKTITNNTAISNITNNRNVQQPVVHQHFNITMPNVTDSTSAASLMNDLQSLATKKYQVDW